MNEPSNKNLNLKCWEIADNCIAANLRRVSRSITKRYDDAMRPLGLRGTQFNLMTAIFLTGPVTITKLAEVLVMDRTTLTRNLGPLRKKEFIDISPGQDQRTRAVSITDSGKRIFKKAIPLWEKTQEEITIKLGKNRTKSMLTDLKAAVKLMG